MWGTAARSLLQQHVTLFDWRQSVRPKTSVALLGGFNKHLKLDFNIHQYAGAGKHTCLPANPLQVVVQGTLAEVIELAVLVFYSASSQLTNLL